MPETDTSKDTAARVELVIDDLFSQASKDFLDSAISRDEGQFLRDLASRPGVQKTIEVGCANGVSSLYICGGLSSKQKVSHIAIDPFQSSNYEGRGVENVRRAGVQFFELIEQPSEIALPALLGNGRIFDMAFIDGKHTADQALLDFYFLDRMVGPGGIVVFDDVHFPSVNKVVRYVSTYPNYQLIGTSGQRGAKRRLTNTVKQCAAVAVWPAKKILGEAICREFLDVSLLHPEMLWTIDSSTMAAFQKTHEFNRDIRSYKGI